MNIVTYIYLIVIRPLEILFELFFNKIFVETHNYGVTIIFLSILVNLLVLPLYSRADKIQKEEERKYKSINRWESHIKKSFKGDERFMMLQAYYRQNNYKPYYSLKNIIPLFLEIPFFIAAFRFLSGLIILQGVNFSFIKDLSQPDAAFSIGDVSINILPILMTAINIVSSLIYGRDSSLKNKIQMYIMAIVFLALLYNSPSCLCLYWTMNNVFSLFKNVIYLFIDKLKARLKDKKDKKEIKEGVYPNKAMVAVFISSAVFISLLLGVYIPAMAIGSSPEEFCNMAGATVINPNIYILYNFLISIGFFLFWGGVIFFLASKKNKYIVSYVILSFSVISLINVSSINEKERLNKYLLFDGGLDYPKYYTVQGIVIILASLLLCFLVIKKYNKFPIYVMSVGIVVTLIMTVGKIKAISNAYLYVNEIHTINDKSPEITLSKYGKNVIVIMMDRMNSLYIPYLINEKPELTEKFKGFTYYPNCVTLGSSTNTGSPGLYGGYEYTPEEMNKRNDVLLKDKHNEAIKLMPVLFNNNDYDVTVCDPTYADYHWIPDLRVFDDYPEINKYITMGKLNDVDTTFLCDYKIKRNLFFYSLIKISPTFLRSYIYDYGNYNEPYYVIGVSYQSKATNHSAIGILDGFYNSYRVLDNLDSITKISDEKSNTFLMMSNDVTHEPMMLQEPDYVIEDFVDNYEYDKNHSIRTDGSGNELKIFTIETNTENDHRRIIDYESNMAAMLKLGEYFDFLRENEVYDNTRIIIVSDHSGDSWLDKNYIYDLSFPDGSSSTFDLYRMQSTLLVKDFDSKEFIIDNSFMTNADVPTLATEELIDNPQNPFTGKSINSDRKKEGNLQLQANHIWSTDINNGYTYLPEHWFTVHDNIFDKNNWSYLGYY